MSTPTVPGRPDASDCAGGKHKRGVGVITGGAALIAIALAATACTATPSRTSSTVSLSGADRPTVTDAAGDLLPGGDSSGEPGGFLRSARARHDQVCPIGSRHRDRSAVVHPAAVRSVHGASFVRAGRGRRAVGQQRLRRTDHLGACPVLVHGYRVRRHSPLRLDAVRQRRRSPPGWLAPPRTEHLQQRVDVHHQRPAGRGNVHLHGAGHRSGERLPYRQRVNDLLPHRPVATVQ